MKNHLADMFRNLSASATVPMDVHNEVVASGGASLWSHAKEKDVENALMCNNCLDYVILQDQSETPGGGQDPDSGLAPGVGQAKSLESLKKFYHPLVQKAVEHVGSSRRGTLFMETWGQRVPTHFHPLNRKVYPDFLTMTQRTSSGYQLYADALGDSWVGNILCGRAFELVYADSGGNPLDESSRFSKLYEDGSHPSVKGSYLIANVLWATITGMPPHESGLAFVPEGVTHADVGYLQDVAWRAARPL